MQPQFTLHTHPCAPLLTDPVSCFVVGSYQVNLFHFFAQAIGGINLAADGITDFCSWLVNWPSRPGGDVIRMLPVDYLPILSDYDQHISGYREVTNGECPL